MSKSYSKQRTGKVSALGQTIPCTCTDRHSGEYISDEGDYHIIQQYFLFSLSLCVSDSLTHNVSSTADPPLTCHYN